MPAVNIQQNDDEADKLLRLIEEDKPTNELEKETYELIQLDESDLMPLEEVEIADTNLHDIRSITRTFDTQKLKYYLGDKALLRLIYDVKDMPPEEQKSEIQKYAKKVVDNILYYADDPDVGGVMLNLDFPNDISQFKKQLKNLIFEINESYEDTTVQMLEYMDFDADDFEVFKLIAGRVRRSVFDLINLGSDEEGYKGRVYMQERFRGQGGIGAVYNCRIGNKTVALKIDKKALKEGSYRGSMKVVEKLKNATKDQKNLVSFFGSMILTALNEDKWKYRMDFFEEFRDLQDAYGYLSDRNELLLRTEEDPNGLRIGEFLETIFLPVLQGVKSLHDKNLVHRDLKLANFFITEEGDRKVKEKDGSIRDIKGGKRVMVGDYDLVTESGVKQHDIYGTPAYMSPEQVTAGFITVKSDIYTLGKILYEMVGGEMPDVSSDFNEAIIMAAKGIDISGLKTSDDLRNLIRKCTQLKPENRPAIDELIEDVKEIIRKNEETKALLSPDQETQTDVFDTLKVAEIEPADEEQQEVA